ncbi:MAG: hypothetical protein FRX49_08065 [Trebouxia sp. A1-2]|nr:MAG: hypothetical protein FRX49_08065 [Trebouxia sp. A1-2]
MFWDQISAMRAAFMVYRRVPHSLTHARPAGVYWTGLVPVNQASRNLDTCKTRMNQVSSKDLYSYIGQESCNVTQKHPGTGRDPAAQANGVQSGDLAGDQRKGVSVIILCSSSRNPSLRQQESSHTMVIFKSLAVGEQTDQKLGAEVTWSSRGEVKAWSVLSHILRPSPGRVVIPNIANLACEGQGNIPPASYQPPVIGVPSGAASLKAESPLYGILLVAGNGPDL